ncbi:flagellar protein FlhE [Marinobacterium sp. MBR-111]|uniref:flagellar protein FlhE n=1 Tax=Marinobacterium sp. MBR-111 TaxID=3156463 RepID=UPI00339783FD
MKKLNFLKLCAALLFSALSSVSYASSASYVDSSPGAAIYSPNTWYQTNFDVLGNPPSDSSVTSVSWQYASRSIPPGGTWVAWLCHGTTSACINVSTLSSGSSEAFRGRSAATKFFLIYGIGSSSSFAPVYGGTDQVIVNYNY